MVPREYKGTEVTEDIISKIKSICEQRYSPLVYKEYFENLTTMQDLCEMHDTNLEEEIILLGEDWFITYAQKYVELEVLEWVALDNVENKMAQIQEMLKALKYILYLSRKTCLAAYLRHDTSYKFYQLGIKRGIIKPAIDEAFVDYYHPEEMDIIVDEVGAKYKDLETFLASPERDAYPEYEQYILHRVVFTPTNKFVKQYKKNEKKKS